MRISVLLVLVSFPFWMEGQIYGTVRDGTGEVLPFASIYLEGSTRGLTTNEAGYYEWHLDPGEYEMVFQYVGNAQKRLKVDYKGGRKELNVVLERQEVQLKEVVVSAAEEDPAYPIIREAIAKRKYYRNLIQQYKCKVYIKGHHKILEAPEKIMGQELGNLGGILDSNGQGTLYLAESLAELYYKAPDQYKEVMTSSKVSGQDNGFGFNRASLMQFNFYDPHVEIERQILSPIAGNAMQYYRYRLEGAFLDEGGRLINKIAVLPKRNEDPVVRGHIYITDALWNIHSVDFYVLGATIKQPVLDTLRLQQVHVPTQGDTWILLSQKIDFRFKVLGLEVVGLFTGIFSDYDFEAETTEELGKEMFRIEPLANKRNLAYWDSIRPIPLTLEEEKDYIIKDSLQEIWKSKPFMDSMDRVGNRFTPFSLLFGYRWDNSYRKRSFSFPSPLTTIQFNPVQGWFGHLEAEYKQDYGEFRTRGFNVKPKLQYGFADHTFRPSGSLTYRFNAVNRARLGIEGGNEVIQFAKDEPISPTLNTLYSIFFKQNYMRLFEQDFIKLTYRQELLNGFYFNGYLEWSKRDLLTNNTDWTWSGKDRPYWPNVPDGGYSEERPFNPHKALVIDFKIAWHPGQTYISYPERRYTQEGKWPKFTLAYRKGMPVDKMYQDFDLLRLRVSDKIEMGLLGHLKYWTEGGVFTNNNRVDFPSFRHFNGNRLVISDPEKYGSGFLQLPYYDYSTDDGFLQAHVQHFWEGWLLDKMPLLRRLNWKSVWSGHYLYVPERGHYHEVAIGIENIGFGVFRIFRVDLSSNFIDGKYEGMAFRLGIDL